MTDITPVPPPEEDPQHVPSPDNRREDGSQAAPAEGEDARDPSRVPEDESIRKPAIKPADEQEVEAKETQKGLEWADDDKRTVDRRSHPTPPGMDT